MAKIVGFKRSANMWRVAHGDFLLAATAFNYWNRHGDDGLVRRVPPSRTHKHVDLALRVSDVGALERWGVENEKR